MCIHVCVYKVGQRGLQLVVWKIIWKVINNNTRINCVSHTHICKPTFAPAIKLKVELLNQKVVNTFGFFTLFFKRFHFYLFIFREGKGERKKERERNINVWLPLTWLPTGALAHNPGLCPDWESNQWPFGSQAGTQSTQPHQPGWLWTLVKSVNSYYQMLSRKAAPTCTLSSCVRRCQLTKPCPWCCTSSYLIIWS